MDSWKGTTSSATGCADDRGRMGALDRSTSYGAARIRYKGSRPSLISVLSRTPLGKTYKEHPL